MSENDDATARNPAKRPQTSRVSDIHNVGNIMNMGKDNKTISTTNGQYPVRIGGVNTTYLTLVVISTPYIHPHNELNTIQALKGTKLKPFHALLAPLPERFTTINNAK